MNLPNTTPLQGPKMEDYDLEQVYDQEIAPLMKEIIEICRRDGIPFLASFAYACKESEVHYCTTSINRNGVSPGELVAARNMIRHGFAAIAVSVSSKPQTEE